MLAHQEVAAQPRPRPLPDPDRDVDVRRVEINQLVAHRHAHREFGIEELEAADARAEPATAETRHRVDRQHLGLVAAQCGERSEEHTSELQSLMRISYAVFCLKKKTDKRLTPLYICRART